MFLDSILPILAFLLVINSGIDVAKAKGFTRTTAIELIISIFILAFAIWKESDNSDKMQDITNDNKAMKENIDRLHSERSVDSSNNSAFQKFVHDSLGYERQGNKAVRVYYNTFNQVKSTPNQVTGTPPNSYGIPDSLNAEANRIVRQLLINPIEGSWAHAYVALDTTYDKDKVMDEGAKVSEIQGIGVNGKGYISNVWKIYTRAVYKGAPIRVNLWKYGNDNFIIFGDEGYPNRRYMYKSGKVTWIPAGKYD